MAQFVFIQEIDPSTFLYFTRSGESFRLRRYNSPDAPPVEIMRQGNGRTAVTIEEMARREGNSAVPAPNGDLNDWRFWYEQIERLNQRRIAGGQPPPTPPRGLARDQAEVPAEPFSHDEEHPIEIRGYSERGMMNAVFHEIAYSAEGTRLLRSFLEQCTFPFFRPVPNFAGLNRAKFIIEQSFSDFGDLDTLILLDDVSGQKHSIFIEAKVKTYQANRWSIDNEWAEFLHMIQIRRPDSNLFIQLYRKMRLVRKVQNPHEHLGLDAVGTRWSLGDNGVVRRAARLLAGYCPNTWFLALVPDSHQTVAQFFCNQLHQYVPNPEELPDWNAMRCGYLTWEKLRDICDENARYWRNSLENFHYNNGQIYATRQGPPVAPPPPRRDPELPQRPQLPLPPPPPAGLLPGPGMQRPIPSRSGDTPPECFDEPKRIPNGASFPRTVVWRGRLYFFIKKGLNNSRIGEMEGDNRMSFKRPNDELPPTAAFR